MRFWKYMMILLIGVLVIPNTSRAQPIPTPKLLANDPLLITDFESGIAEGADADGNGVGFVTWHDPSSSIVITTTTSLPAPVPGITTTNTVLQWDANVISWGGFTNALSNPNLDAWVPQDWSRYAGIRFWLYGQNTGTSLFVDLLDNRASNATTDSAERWSTAVTDNWSGWQLIEVPFASLTRKEIGNGAPNDGLGLNQVHGWALGALNTSGPKTWYVDQVELYGDAPFQPLSVRFATNSSAVTEGNSASVMVQLNKPYTQTVTVEYSTLGGTATIGRDVNAVAGMLTFTPGVTQQSFTVDTIDDVKYEGNETIVFMLSNPVDVQLGALTQHILNINDDELFDPYLVDDFEGPISMITTTSALTVEAREIALGAADELPGQGAFEEVLDVEATGPGSWTHNFAGSQDWTDSTGLTFWYYGTGSGMTQTLELLDNQAVVTGTNNWQLVWSDEFDAAAGTAPDPAIWSYELGDGSLNGIPGWGNDELQYYTNNQENVAHDGQGNLDIVVRESDDSLNCYYGPCEYTSARLLSKDKAEFEFGRIEARIDVPEGAGIWPAFWMLGSDIAEVNWPQTGEIDIMEYVGREPYEVFGTIHGPGYSGGNSFGGVYTFADPVADNFHTFAVDWQPGMITWSVDDIVYHEATPADVAPNEWVFDHSFFMLLNVAIGGNFGGPVGNITLPQTMTVDYVRVYQNVDSSERFEATFVDSQAGWQQISVPFTSFVRSATQPDGAPNDGLTLAEVWGYGMRTPAAVSYSVDQVRRVPDCLGTNMVMNTDDDGIGSLRDAIAQTCIGGTITFDPSLAHTTIDLSSGPLELTGDVVIEASAAPGLALSGMGSDRVLIVNAPTVAMVSGLTITNGYAWDLAGAVLNNGELTLEDVVVTNNMAASDANEFWKGGGAIYNGEASTLRLYNSAVVSNTTTTIDGGGIYSFVASTTIISNSAIISNTGGNVGGGLRSLGDVEIVNSTFSGNHSTAWHGGAIFHTDASLAISSSTIADNTAPSGVTGGILVATFGPNSPNGSLENNIIANNSGPQCGVENQGAGTASITSLGHNLSTDASCPITATGDLPDTDPELRSLMMDSGTWVHLPAQTSPAIDAAGTNCPASDQRGISRPQGDACDIGSVELVSVETPAWTIFLPIVRR